MLLTKIDQFAWKLISMYGIDLLLAGVVHFNMRFQYQQS